MPRNAVININVSITICIVGYTSPHEGMRLDMIAVYAYTEAVSLETRRVEMLFWP